jgi:hypothetical protein
MTYEQWTTGNTFKDTQSNEEKKNVANDRKNIRKNDAWEHANKYKN